MKMKNRSTCKNIMKLLLVVCAFAFWLNAPQKKYGAGSVFLSLGYPNILTVTGKEDRDFITSKLQVLSKQWQDFQLSLEQNPNPVESFQNSPYLQNWLHFFSHEESSNVSQQQIQSALEQPNIHFYEKNFFNAGKVWTIRCIYYPVNYYVQDITDWIPMPNKWIFIQCWREDGYYFQTIADGDIFQVQDILLFEKNETAYVALWGYAYEYYPLTPFIQVFEFTEEGLMPAEIFSADSLPEGKVFTETEAFFAHDLYDTWVFYTDGSLFMANRKCRAVEKGKQPSDFLKLEISVDEVAGEVYWAAENWFGDLEGRLFFSLPQGEFRGY